MLSEYKDLVQLSKLPAKRKELFHYIVGFVDAEGCFSIACKKQEGTRFGWVLDPVFHVTQRVESRFVLELIHRALACGRIIPKPGQPETLQFLVDNRRQLAEKVIPFFEKYPLWVKSDDFGKFKFVVESLERKDHADLGKFKKMLRTAFSMNLDGKQRRYDIEQVLLDLDKQDPQRLYAEHPKEGEDIVRSSK